MSQGDFHTEKKSCRILIFISFQFSKNFCSSEYIFWNNSRGTADYYGFDQKFQPDPIRISVAEQGPWMNLEIKPLADYFTFIMSNSAVKLVIFNQQMV
jgi:hypothetical protein